MAKITLDGIVSGFKSVAKLISNFDSIEDNLNNKVLYRDNPEGEPNQMEGELDMNSNRILNLPTATSASEPLTYGQYTGQTGPVQFEGTVVENQLGSEAVGSVFTLTTTTFTPGLQNLAVYINGVRQLNSTYVETSTTQITFSTAPVATDEYTFVVNERAVDADSYLASNVIYTPSGTAAVDTDTQSKLREIVSVNDFDTVANAVAHCYTNSLALYWPDIQTVTGNIPNFHNVKHWGKGGVNTGSSIFYFEPSDGTTNTVYVNTSTGSDTNDGLDSARPTATIQQAIDNYENYAPLNEGAWVIDIADGTYNEQLIVPHNMATTGEYLTIKGTEKASVQTTPTVILDGTGLGAPDRAIDLGRYNSVVLKNMLLQEWDVAKTTDGVQVGAQGFGWLYNIQCTDGKLRSLWLADRNAIMLIQGGRCSGGTTIGYDSYSGTTTTIGYKATSTANSTIIEDTTQAGAYIKSYGHVVSNYVQYNDNTLAVLVWDNARYDPRGDDFKRNSTVYELRGGALTESTSAPPVYNHGGVDANTTVYKYTRYSSEFSQHDLAIGGLDVAHIASSTATSGTTKETLKTLYTIPAYFLELNRYFEIEIIGDTSGSAGTKTLYISVDGTDVATVTLPSGSSDFKTHGKLFTINNANKNAVTGSFSYEHIDSGGISFDRAGTSTDSTSTMTIEVKAQTTDAGDNIAIREARCVLWG